MFDSEFTQVIDMGEAQPVSICDVVQDFLRIFSGIEEFFLGT